MNGLDRIREAAKRDKTARFTNLMHHITVDLLRESFIMALKRDAAPGVDDVRWREYGDGLEEHLPDLHQEKTRLIEFGRFAAVNRAERGEGKPETFDFLGFTHICGRTRKDNRYTVRRKTIAKRLRAKVAEVREELMRRRHTPVPEQGKWVRTVVQGHLNYYAVPGNKQATETFRTQAMRNWFYALRRRSQKARSLTWERFKNLVRTLIPTARVLHPYPNQRLCVTNPR